MKVVAAGVLIWLRMDAVASRALEEGVQVLRPLYANLPADMREKALAMIERFDPAGVVATSHFIASGSQPFMAAADLTSLEVPTLLVRGDDPMHPAEVSDVYAATIPDCTAVPTSTTDVAAAIGAFVNRCLPKPDETIALVRVPQTNLMGNRPTALAR